jgi:ParB family transcriptional regulator, chromosome partitioning protein
MNQSNPKVPGATNTKKMMGLGRGLGALLQDSDAVNRPQQPRTSPYETISTMNEISVHQIETNPFQPRTRFDEEALQELAESIRMQGIIQPITVRQIGKDSYQLIAGERRLQASKMIGLTHIPAYIRTANDQQMLEMALIENIQRENLNSIEIALSYQRLITECSLKQEELGERVGKNRTTVNNYIRLLKLPPVIQVALRDTKISMGHARAIINIENPDRQISLFNKIIAEDWSVRKVEEAVRNLSNETETTESARKTTLPKQEMRTLQFKLSSLFGTKVSIKADEAHKGEIKIPFTSQEELAKILELLNHTVA